MKILSNHLTHPDANYVFNDGAQGLVNDILVSTLRYIAIQRCDNKIENLSPIKIFRYTVTSYSSLPSTMWKAFAEDASKSAICFIVGDNQSFTNSKPGEDWEEIKKLDNGEKMTQPRAVVTMLCELSKTQVFINKDLEKTVIFVQKMNDSWQNRFASGLFVFLPWLYPDKELPDHEKQLFEAISKNNTKSLCSLIDSDKDIFNFRSIKLRMSLEGFKSEIQNIKIRELEEEVAYFRRQIVEYLQKVGSYESALSEILMTLSGLKSLPPNDDDEIYELFNRRKNIYEVDVNKNGRHSSIVYTIVDTIEYYDAEAFLETFKNKASYLYSSPITPAARELVYALLVDEKGKLKTKCSFSLKGLYSILPIQFADLSSIDAMPHPHVDQHACLGGNASQIQEYLGRHDLDLAVDQTIQAAKNLNVGDATVMTFMLNWISSNLDDCQMKIIIADNNEEMTLKEFYDYISPTQIEIQNINTRGIQTNGETNTINIGTDRTIPF